MSTTPSAAQKIITSGKIPTWENLESKAFGTPFGEDWQREEALREKGNGAAHTNAKVRLFGTTGEPRITFFRDTAAWCPYCQKLWILLEEKKIPYKVQKINMRSYGDKPAEFLRLVPGGLLPAILIDNKRVQTESLEIMLNLDSMFTGPPHISMWPAEGTEENIRAKLLMKLERQLFGAWCNLVFRPPGEREQKQFEICMDEVEKQLKVTAGPFFLSTFSIVDLTYITHVERMAASIAYWTGFLIRGNGRWPAIEHWMSAFEDMPSYMATKSDYYTHVMDIPPQYGPGCFATDEMRDGYAAEIDGRAGSWTLPLPSLSERAVEPVRPQNDPGEQTAKDEAALKLLINQAAINAFALRGAGAPGAKRFQAPLADPYATPALEYKEDMDALLRHVVNTLLNGHSEVDRISIEASGDETVKRKLRSSLSYLKDRIGVPRDMSYPAARQLRAHLNWVIGQI